MVRLSTPPFNPPPPHLPPSLSSSLNRSDLACNMALDAVKIVAKETSDRKEIDIKRYAKVEKVQHVYCPPPLFNVPV